ncbi:MAG: hypothetical protein ACP5NF_06695 [Thermoanaerobaculum sp.]
MRTFFNPRRPESCALEGDEGFLAPASVVPQPWPVTFAADEVLPVRWWVEASATDLPDRWVECLSPGVPLPDLKVRGNVDADENLGPGRYLVHLEIANEGQITAPRVELLVSLGSESSFERVPQELSCRVKYANSVTCWLGDLEPGRVVAGDFVVQGSLNGLRQGRAWAKAALPDANFSDDSLWFSALVGGSPRRVLPPSPPRVPGEVKR